MYQSNYSLYYEEKIELYLCIWGILFTVLPCWTREDNRGVLRAWGTSRVLDYLKQDANVDAQKVGIEGVSRYGKAALVAVAYDPRFAMVLIGSSGKGGAHYFAEIMEKQLVF